jgi:hypothetical protein
MNRKRILLVAVSATLVVSACSSKDTKQTSTTSSAPSTSGRVATSTTSAVAAYHPTIDPSTFTSQITNKYFPLKPGSTRIYEGTRDGQPTHTELLVTNETKVIMGVTNVVVRDTVTSNNALVEKTTDWYAQAANGDVWYFGESTAEYMNGAVSSTHGSWEAGVDGAQPGIVMKANPKIGDNYRQEYRPGEAEDMAKVLSVEASVQVPAGTYANAVVTEDTDPLNPDKLDQKKYGPGAGMIYTKRVRTGHTEESSLVKATNG